MNPRSLTLPALLAVASLSAQAITYETSQWFGTIRPPLAPPTGEVVDRIFVGDNFKGLTYADQDLIGSGTTPTLFYSIRHDAGSGVGYLDTIATPVAPHAVPPAVVDRFAMGSLPFNALTFAAPDVSFGPTQLYYLRESGGGSQFGTATAAGAVQDRFATGNKLDSLTFAATDVGFGANLFYYLRRDGTGTHFGTIDPHLPGTVTDRATLNLDILDALVFTSTDVGYGANLFYYVRRETTTGQSQFGTINPQSGVAVDRFAIGTLTDHFSELTFTTTDVGYGANLFYYLRTQVPETGTSGALIFCGLLVVGSRWVASRRQP